MAAVQGAGIDSLRDVTGDGLGNAHQSGANTASQAKRVSLWLAGAGGIAAIAVIALGGFMLAGSFFPGASWAVLSLSIGSFPVSIVVLSASLGGASLLLTIFFSLLCQKTKSNAKNDDHLSENPVGVTGIVSSKASETGAGQVAEGGADSASDSDTKTTVSAGQVAAVSEDSDTDTDTDTKTAVSAGQVAAVSEDSDTDTDTDTDTKTAVSAGPVAVSEDSDTGTKTVVEQGEVNISAGKSGPGSSSYSPFDVNSTRATISFATKKKKKAPELPMKFTIAWSELTKTRPSVCPLYPADRKKYETQALAELEKCNKERQAKGFEAHPDTLKYMKVLSPSVKS